MAFNYSRDSTDLNQKEIVKALRKLGAKVTITTSVKKFCDLVVGWNGQLFLLEVKDGSKPPSQRQLTQGELEAVRDYNNVGCQIYVVNNIDEAVDIIFK